MKNINLVLGIIILFFSTTHSVSCQEGEYKCCFCFYGNDPACTGPPDRSSCQRASRECEWVEITGSCADYHLRSCQAWTSEDAQVSCDKKEILPEGTDPDTEGCTTICGAYRSHSNQVTNCSTLSRSITYCIENSPDCGSINFTHLGCQTFSNLDQSQVWFDGVARDAARAGISLTVTGNQNISWYNRINFQYHQLSQTTFTIAGCPPRYPGCPPIGEKCLAHPGQTGIKCFNMELGTKIYSCCNISREGSQFVGTWTADNCSLLECSASGFARTSSNNPTVCLNHAEANALTNDSVYLRCKEDFTRDCADNGGTISDGVCIRKRSHFAWYEKDGQSTCDNSLDCLVECKVPTP